jgi:competence protein ComEA
MIRSSQPKRHRRVAAATVFITAALGAGGAIAAAATAAASPSAPPAASAAMPLGHERLQRQKTPSAPVRLIDINSASRKELKTLPGIGDAEAAKIVANRPYLSKAELVTRNVIPTGPYLELKNRIIAMQNGPPKAKT